MRPLLSALVTAGLLLAAGPSARAEFDWPAELPVPDWDVAVGLTGAFAFGEEGTAHHMGVPVGADVSLLHGVFGLHLGIRAHREGFSTRVGAVLEVSWWYLVMIGVGASVGGMVESGGPNVPDVAAGLTILLGVPIPLARISGGKDGAILLMPYGRPGLRFVADDDIRGFHEVGLMLKWTSFGF